MTLKNKWNVFVSRRGKNPKEFIVKTKEPAITLRDIETALGRPLKKKETYTVYGVSLSPLPPFPPPYTPAAPNLNIRGSDLAELPTGESLKQRLLRRLRKRSR